MRRNKEPTLAFDCEIEHPGTQKFTEYVSKIHE
jgi:hypothetical protein